MKLTVATALLFSIICLNNFACKKTDTITGLPSINNENNRVVGASANELLSAATYSSVKIEIQYMPGYAPDAAAVANITSFLSTLINKPGGISITQAQINASGKQVLSLNDIAAIEKNNRTVYTSGNQLGVYVLFTDGGYAETNVLGVAYRNTSMSILGKTVHDNSGGIGQASRTKLETTVMQHELGHLMGLVDVGTAMQTNHKDASHGSHCNNNNCLMYYASETTEVLGFLLTGSIPPLDANCRADLKANGGK